jgi:class 3 adenylate cyclase
MQAGASFSGKGVHEAARIAALATGGEILASVATVADSQVATSAPRSVMLKGLSEPMEVVAVEWR